MKPLRLMAVIEARDMTGPAKNLLEFARLARTEGVETHVVTFVRGEPSNFFVETARGESIPIHTIPERGRFDRAAVRSLGGLAARIAPGVVQTHAVKSHFLARLAGLPEKFPWVAFHHGYTWPVWHVRLYNQLDRWSLRSARKVLTVSRPFRQELEAKGVRKDRVEIIHNAIEPDWGVRERTPEKNDALRASWNIPKDRRVILIVGRLSREKDHLALLEAVHLLKIRPARTGLAKIETPPHLVIVGEGPERPFIEQKIKALELAEFVTLTGQQKSAGPYYGIADVAVLSSRTEGSPNALLEAMAAGVPAVATRVGGIPEIVTHEDSALLVEPGDVPALAQSIGRLLEDRPFAQRLAVRAGHLIRERYTPAERTRRLVEIYRKIAD